MRYQYQGTPATPPSPQLGLGSGSITSNKAGTKYFWLQYRNRAGYSSVSASASIAVAAGQKIIVTIPTGAKPASVGGINGTDIHEYVILMATANDVTTAATVATFPGYQSDGTPYGLPAVIELTQDQHLALTGLTVANEAALPASPVHGMRRAIASPSRFVAYDAVFSPTGWKDVYPQVFSTYVPDTTELNGSDVSIVDISDTAVILTPDYGVDGTASKAIGFWLVNNESNPIPSGTRIGLSFDLDSVDVSSQFVGLASIIFQGYVNKTTGELDTSAMVVNTAIPYSGAQTGMVLQKALPVGSAVFLQVRLEFRAFQLRNRPVQGSVLRASPYLYADFAQYNADSSLLGSFIAAEYDRRRIVPSSGANSAKALKGSGTISLSSGGGYTFQAVPESSVIGLEANTPSQKVFLAINGSLYVAGSTIEGAVLRAIVGTVNGLGHIKTWSGSYALTSSNLLEITVTYPLNISPDYPDVIAGSGAGYFNPSGIRFFVRPVGGGTIKYFDGVVLAGVSQTFTIGLSGTDTTIGSLPSNPAASFGLYRATDASYAIAPVSGSSVFSSTNYEVAIAFIYTDRVTSISHSPLDGCVLEADSTIGELFEKTKYNRAPVTDLDALRAVSSTTTPNFQKCIVASLRWEYQYQNDSYLVDDTTNSSYAVKPNDLTSIQAGRWIRLQRFGVGTVTLGADEYDYAMTLTDSSGIQNINLTIPRGVRGLRGFTGTPGDKGETGTVGTNTGVVITSGTTPTTSGSQVALYNDSNTLKLRNPSNGASEQVATLNRVQTFTKGQAIAPITLTDASIISVDASQSNNFRILLVTSVGTTRILENPTNLSDGQELVFLFQQPVAGGCKLTFDTQYIFIGDSGISLEPLKTSLITCRYDLGTGVLNCTVWGSGRSGAAKIKTSSFTADLFGEYVINSSADVVVTHTPSVEPEAGASFSFFAIKTATGFIRPDLYTGIVNGLYRGDAYFSKDTWIKLTYIDSTFGWSCPTTNIFNGLLQGLISFWNFNGSSLTDSAGARNFSDTGSTAIVYTSGIIGANALNFNNSSANYQLSQSDLDLSPTTIPFADTLGFSLLVNLTSGTEPIISQKWASDSTKYTYCVRAIDATHIQFSIETGGTGGGVFTATATVAAAYGVPLLIIVTMPVVFTVKSPRIMELQVNDGDIVSTVITGTYQSSAPLIVGQTESGSQIVGVVDQIRAYNWEIDSNQRSLLWNNGSFV